MTIADMLRAHGSARKTKRKMDLVADLSHTHQDRVGARGSQEDCASIILPVTPRGGRAATPGAGPCYVICPLDSQDA